MFGGSSLVCSSDRVVDCGSVHDRVLSTSNRLSAPPAYSSRRTISKGSKSVRLHLHKSFSGNGTTLAVRPGSTTQGRKSVETYAISTFGNARKEAYESAYGKLKIADYMTSPAFYMDEDTDVYTALKVLVDKGISGFPIVDAEIKPIGVVSGFDLLALDATPGHVDRSDGMFPSVGSCEEHGGDKDKMWSQHFRNADLVSKAGADKVGDIMHAVETIHETATLEEASCAILKKQLHRLSVVDSDGKLVGMISRGDIVRASLGAMKDVMDTVDRD